VIARNINTTMTNFKFIIYSAGGKMPVVLNSFNDMQTLIRSSGFRAWIENSLATQENVLATSNQGTLLLYEKNGFTLVVKSAMGPALLYRARLATLRREYAAYQRLEGLAGIPKCHGMVDKRYLVLDYIEGTSYRHTEWTDRAAWFAEFLELIQQFHARGVSHGDLKSKSNIIVTPDQMPCVIDFGTAWIRKDGFHPINKSIFEYTRRLDMNAWVKHKYHGRYEDVAEADQKYLNYSWIEKILRKFRPG
jgi:serine/threonine protein kinase